MEKRFHSDKLEKIKNPGVQSKFLIGLAVILLFFCFLSSSFIYFYLKTSLEEESFRKTELVMSAVAATRKYVRETLRPKMYEVLGQDAFVIEAMSSSYISRIVMDNFNEELPDFRYRRVSINARNPDFEATETEKEMIRFFQSNPEIKSWQGTARIGEQRYFIRYSPVFFKKSCLHCHGAPEQAPGQIIENYGPTGGFNKDISKISSIVSVGIPLESSLERIQGIAFSVFSTAFLVIFILYAIIMFFFNKLIVQNLQGLLQIFWNNLDDQYGRQLYEKTKTMDEIGELSSAAEIIANHLQETKDHLTESKELLQSVFDGITDFVVVISPLGEVKMINKAITVRYGLKLEDIFNCNIKSLSKEHPLPFSLFTKILGVQLRERAGDLIAFSPKEIFEVHFFPVLSENGELANIVCYAKDVTLQKLTEQKIQHSEKLVSVGQLAAGVAHEINNPLGIILTYTDLLKDDLQSDSQKLEDLRVIEKHVKNCQRIIKDLLDFASPKKNAPVKTSINEVIEEAVHMVRHQFTKKNIDLTLKLPQKIPLLILDADKIKQVLINLIINAMQAIQDNGSIRVSSSHSKKYNQVKVTVEDNGPGIPPEQLDKIFDPFFTTKEPSQGTGLGLSLSYGLIQDHGGDIYVSSEQGKGSCFTIIFPLTDPKK